MRRRIAVWLNEQGLQYAENGNRREALRYYSRARRADPTWSVPVYNIGLQYKYLGKWQESLSFNKQATELDPADEASWWNLAIAATALHDWPEARRAWNHLGIDIPDGEGEWTGPPMTACVRLNPNETPEVVWGERVDPARFVVLNVPLPESQRRFRDIVLNDGAPNGTRTRDGIELPVFDELELWRPSRWATFQVIVQVSSAECEARLVELCHARDFGIEDWSTIRWLCAECSRGNPGPHECLAGDPDNPWKPFAIAAPSGDEVRTVLEEWKAASGEASYRDVEMLVAAG